MLTEVNAQVRSYQGVQTWKKRTNKRETDNFEFCTVTGQEATGIN